MYLSTALSVSEGHDGGRGRLPSGRTVAVPQVGRLFNVAHVGIIARYVTPTDRKRQTRLVHASSGFRLCIPTASRLIRCRPDRSP
jgi:hypothetical protein